MRSHHSLDVGDIACVALRAAEHSPTIGLIDLLTPPDGDETKRPISERTTSIQGTHSCLLVRTDRHTVLIDGGLSAATVRSALHDVDVIEGDIDLVLITHGDTDHIAGLLDDRRDLVYADARYVLARGLWEAWISDGTRGDPDPFYEEEQRTIARALAERIDERALLLDGDTEIEPGIHAIAAPGHRPSHVAYELTSGEDRLLHVGDAFIAPILVEASSRGNAFDTDPDLGIRSRLALLRRAARPRTITYVPHFPFPGLVRIVERNGAFSCEAP